MWRNLLKRHSVAFQETIPLQKIRGLLLSTQRRHPSALSTFIMERENLSNNLEKGRRVLCAQRMGIHTGQPVFQTICLLSVEGKIFFSVLAKRMSAYVTQNWHIWQFGGIGRFSGGLEHTGVLSQLIQEAKEKKGNLTVVWLDFANAHGSIPYNLVQVALDHYHIPHHIQDMITINTSAGSTNMACSKDLCVFSPCMKCLYH